MLDHIVQTDTAQRLSEFLLGNRENRKHDFNDQFGLQLVFGCVDRPGSPKHVIDRHAMALDHKFITTMRAADALKNAAVDQ